MLLVTVVTCAQVSGHCPTVHAATSESECGPHRTGTVVRDLETVELRTGFWWTGPGLTAVPQRLAGEPVTSNLFQPSTATLILFTFSGTQEQLRSSQRKEEN